MAGHGEKKGYPLGARDYNLLEEIGQGVSATVYRAICLPYNEVVAVKSLDLEKCTSNLDEIRREAQTMSLICHPNVVKAYCSFVVNHSLWVVMPYLAGGSCLHVMKAAYPDGFEEPVIATVLKESLKALDYLHKHGHIHRDVKAGNILIDGNGAVKLGDFGVSACMFDTGDRQRSRNTFVGTPCWMAPEVMEQVHGYDFKADIWSFGITALELAHGHAPFSKYPPMKVLLMTLQNAPPGLDYERDKRFSKSFKEMIAMCLVKDPARRPSAEKLLKHSFFKNARSYEYVARHVLDGLPPLGERVKNLKLKDAARLAQKKMPYVEQQERSLNEYKRGVSCWNFNVEELKAEAALIHDDILVSVNREEEECPHFVPQDISLAEVDSRQLSSLSETDVPHLRATDQLLKSEISVDVVDRLVGEGTGPCSAGLHLGGRFDLVENIVVDRSSDGIECGREFCLSQEDSKEQSRSDEREKYGVDDREKRNGRELRRSEVKGLNSRSDAKDPNCDLVFSDRIVAPTKILDSDEKNFDTDHRQLGRSAEDVFRSNVSCRDRGVAGPFSSTSAARAMPDQVSSVHGAWLASRSSSLKDGGEEKSKGQPVQRKGRFSVTSEHVELVEDVLLRKSASVGDWLYDGRHDAPTLASTSSQAAPSLRTYVPRGTILLDLRNILRQATNQEELLVNLICSLTSAEGSSASSEASSGSKFFPIDSRVELESDRGQEITQKSAELQSRIANIVDELQGIKFRNIQLEHQILEASKSQGVKVAVEENSQGPFIHRKGRFSVTSEDVKLAENGLLRKVPGVADWLPKRRSPGFFQSPLSNSMTTIPIGAILPQLQNVLQQASIQQDLLVNLIWSITTDNFDQQRSSYPGLKRFSRTVSVGKSASVVELASQRDIRQQISELQGKIADLSDDLELMKLANIQLERQRKLLWSNEEERVHREKALEEFV